MNDDKAEEDLGEGDDGHRYQENETTPFCRFVESITDL
jgi:hypothetical protein